jgi:hypothetical protein
MLSGRCALEISAVCGQRAPAFGSDGGRAPGRRPLTGTVGPGRAAPLGVVPVRGTSSRRLFLQPGNELRREGNHATNHHRKPPTSAEQHRNHEGQRKNGHLDRHSAFPTWCHTTTPSDSEAQNECARSSSSPQLWSPTLLPFGEHLRRSHPCPHSIISGSRPMARQVLWRQRRAAPQDARSPRHRPVPATTTKGRCAKP